MGIWKNFRKPPLEHHSVINKVKPKEKDNNCLQSHQQRAQQNNLHGYKYEFNL